MYPVVYELLSANELFEPGNCAYKMERTTDVFCSDELMHKNMNSQLFKKFLDQTASTSLTPRTQQQPSPSLNCSVRRSLSPETPPKASAEQKDTQTVMEQALRNYYEDKLTTLQKTFQQELQLVRREQQNLLTSKETSYSKLLQKHERLQKDYSHLEEQLHAVENRKIRQLRQDCVKLEGETEELREDNKQLRRQVEHLREELLKTSRTHDEHERTLKRQLHTCEQDLRLARDGAATLQRKLDNVKEKAGGFQRKLELQKEKTRRLQHELVQPRRSLAEAEPRRSEDLLAPTHSKSPVARHSLTDQYFLGPKVGANASLSMQNALCWQETSSKERKGVVTLEEELFALHMQKRTLENEYARLPERPRRASELNRREELESELNSVTHQIAVVKKKLRQSGAIH